MTNILKTTKEEDAKERYLSTMTIVTPTKRAIDNYSAPLPQLDANKVRTLKVQKKSKARLIADHSFAML